MSNYKRNKAKAIFNNTEPTMTDQSQGHETDINVIVGRYGIGNRVPGAPTDPIYGDFTNFPDNLRDMIHMSRRVSELHDNLPPQLEGKTVEEILALKPEELASILKPPAPPAPPAPAAAGGNGENK